MLDAIANRCLRLASGSFLRLNHRQTVSSTLAMPNHDTASILEAFSREGLAGAELDAAVLAYKTANNLPLDNSGEAGQ